ncbi:hypothetical protein APHNP_0197 [Anaplasma phagocytophilum str. ApNP]|uniref:Uncharacterized protein n=1 Tax=Anaplasma phagocytophilum str. ApNP TaxID=1359153 RepID=A0A0F3NGV7_ANAPH|nr:hypothetical protein APHNP_0197 [Anaplasma phagocytophilum str. ApNP]
MEDSCFYWNLQFSAVITRRAAICNKLFYPYKLLMQQRSFRVGA